MEYVFSKALEFYVFYFGAIVGSFLNVVILRLPKEESLRGRSHCMSCGHVLSPVELIPLISFLLLRGKCRKCRKSISWRYFGIECLTGALFVFAWHWFSPGSLVDLITVAGVLFFVSICIIIFFIDFEHFLILDRIVFPALAVVLVYKFLLAVVSHGSWVSALLLALLGAAVGSLPFFAVWFFSQGKWMGFGDVKLMLLLGAMAGWQLVLANLFFSIFLGGFTGIILLFFAKKTLKSKVPFGTFLTVGAVVCIFYGKQLLVWYLSLLGI